MQTQAPRFRSARRGSGCRARAAVVWGLAGFFLVQGALTVAIETRWPELSDPEFGYRLARLRRQLHDAPDRRLLLFLGSSRVSCGFRPEALAACFAESGKRPLAANMALEGSGPVQELLCLRRLLARGVRPDWLLVEVLPPALTWDRAEVARKVLSEVYRLRWTDLPRAWKEGKPSGRALGKWLQFQAAPWFKHRFTLQGRFAPFLQPKRIPRREALWRDGLDVGGWLPNPYQTVTAAERREGVEVARRQYEPWLNEFHIGAAADRALRELLDRCRKENVQVALVQMPEGDEFRGWYPGDVRIRVARYLDELCRQTGAVWIDAGGWMSEDSFSDSHHLLPAAAWVFTERLGREVIRPFVEGKPVVFARPGKEAS